MRAYTKSGKRYIVPKDVSIKINRAIWELQNQHREEAISVPVYINVIFILPNRKRRDLDNIMKTLGDCLVYAGILKDDNLIFKQTLEKKIIKGMEGVIIEVGLYNERKINDKIIEKLKSYKEGIDGI
ncbi:MAG: RusA family crossover junction endodeoxyribonuclease [Persephonella sp.]|nr:RusA family crossover junction endodeoxyribonuclease [Persephonella sp.]